MIELMIFFAMAAAEPASPEARSEPTINVRGARTICRRVGDSGQTRMGAQRVCRTQREWDEIRDQAAEFLDDLPRRNPTKSRDLAVNGE